MRSTSLNFIGGLRLRQRWDQQIFGNFELSRIFDRNRSSRVMTAPRLLILSVSAGSGHVRAAQAIEAQARLSFPAMQVQHLDIMQCVPLAFRKIYTDWYMALASRLPEAWGWLYRKTDCPSEGRHRPGWLDATRKLLQQICTRRMLADIAQFAPHAILCTHFLPAEILANHKRLGRLSCPLWVQVTDFDLHQMWVHEGISGYFVANEELAYRLQAQGVPRAHLVVAGIPVMPDFIAPLSRRACAKYFGLDPERTTILIMGGGGGIGNMAALAQRLLKLDANSQLIIMAGKNQALLTALQSMAALFPQRLLAIGFTSEVPALMACADIAITKPGGLSTSECLVMGLPMVLVNPIPGQEERNAGFLLQEGVAVRADDAATLTYRLQRLLADPLQRQSMRTRALALAKPKAATEVLQIMSQAMSAHQKTIETTMKTIC